MYLLSRREFRGGNRLDGRAPSLYTGRSSYRTQQEKKKISLLFYDDAKGGLRR